MRPVELKGVAKLMEKNGLYPLDFNRTGSCDDELIYEYKDSGLMFSIYPHPSDMALSSYSYTNYTRGERIRIDKKNKFLHIIDILSQINYWIQQQVMPYIADQNATDPWTEYQKAFENVVDNEAPFTLKEQSFYKEQLKTFTTALLLEFEIPTDKPNDSIDRLEQHILELTAKIESNNSPRSLIKWAVIGGVIQFAMEQGFHKIDLNAVISFTLKYFQYWKQLPMPPTLLLD